MTPQSALERIKLAVSNHDDTHGVQWFVDDNIIDCSAPEFWGVVLAVLEDMAIKEAPRGDSYDEHGRII